MTKASSIGLTWEEVYRAFDLMKNSLDFLDIAKEEDFKRCNEIKGFCEGKSGLINIIE